MRITTVSRVFLPEGAGIVASEEDTDPKMPRVDAKLTIGARSSSGVGVIASEAASDAYANFRALPKAGRPK